MVVAALLPGVDVFGGGDDLHAALAQQSDQVGVKIERVGIAGWIVRAIDGVVVRLLENWKLDRELDVFDAQWKPFHDVTGSL